eukprot:m.43045 g.43045  ORF g.43045 m.43045 type:complete len:673 (+) comp8388_c0_seq2:286-2304(+)
MIACFGSHAGLRAKSQWNRYRLLEYLEAGVPGTRDATPKPGDIPVFFFPGHDGSFEQVRSLASVVLRRSAVKRKRRRFRFYTFDFAADRTGLNGGLAVTQLDYSIYRISVLLGLEPRPHQLTNSTTRPDIILLGHSIGGIIARAAAENEVLSGCVGLVLTLATPHAFVPLFPDHRLEALFRVHRNGHTVAKSSKGVDSQVLMISIGGGFLDEIIVPEMTLATERDHFVSVSVQSSAIPGVGLSADHKCILWCNQLVQVVAELLLQIAPPASSDPLLPLPARRRVAEVLLSPNDLPISDERGTTWVGHVSNQNEDVAISASWATSVVRVALGKNDTTRAASRRFVLVPQSPMPAIAVSVRQKCDEHLHSPRTANGLVWTHGKVRHGFRRDPKDSNHVSATLMPHPLGLSMGPLHLTVWGDSACTLEISTHGAWWEAVEAVSIANRLRLPVYVAAVALFTHAQTTAKVRRDLEGLFWASCALSGIVFVTLICGANESPIVFVLVGSSAIVLYGVLSSLVTISVWLLRSVPIPMGIMAGAIFMCATTRLAASVTFCALALYLIESMRVKPSTTILCTLLYIPFLGIPSDTADAYDEWVATASVIVILSSCVFDLTAADALIPPQIATLMLGGLLKVPLVACGWCLTTVSALRTVQAAVTRFNEAITDRATATPVA